MPHDLRGQKFGFLTPIEPLEERRNKKVIWKCLCDCGKYTEVSSSDLTSGHTKSCGCMNQSFGVVQICSTFEKNHIPFKQEVSFSDLYDKKPLRFDFGIYKQERLVAIVEFNGPQHFDSKNSFYNETIVKHDKIKRDYCAANNIPLFDINYNDNLKNKI